MDLHDNFNKIDLNELNSYDRGAVNLTQLLKESFEIKNDVINQYSDIIDNLNSLDDDKLDELSSIVENRLPGIDLKLLADVSNVGSLNDYKLLSNNRYNDGSNIDSLSDYKLLSNNRYNNVVSKFKDDSKGLVKHRFMDDSTSNIVSSHKFSLDENEETTNENNEEDKESLDISYSNSNISGWSDAAYNRGIYGNDYKENNENDEETNN